MKIIAMITALLVGGAAAFGQEDGKVYTAGDFFSSDEIVWYGLDFSRARMVGEFAQFGSAGEVSGSTMKNRFYRAWNTLVLNEPRNFNLQRAFRKTRIINDLSVVEARNNDVNPDQIFSYNEQRLAPGDIKEIIAEFKKEQARQGLGLVFIVENFSKIDDIASMYITVFDIARGKVLFTERMTGRPRGFGVRNYWAGAIKRILRDIERDAYKSWRHKYAG